MRLTVGMMALVLARFVDSMRLLPAGQQPGPRWDEPRLLGARGYTELSARFAGCSFENGLYRLHDARTGPAALRCIATAFPEFARRACPFGSDWLGRQFALDGARMVNGESLMLMLDVGSGEVLEIPAFFDAFHGEEVVDYRDAALASELLASWTAQHPETLPLAADRCVGYSVPLFLGGADELSNLEVTDLSLYWDLCGQLLRGSRSLPVGTSIDEVTGA